MKTDAGRGLVSLLAVAAAATVANLYYSQPLLVALRTSFGSTQEAVSRVPMLTQLGYGLGMLALAPLGDRFERRRLIASTTAVTSLVLVGVALRALARLADRAQRPARPRDDGPAAHRAVRRHPRASAAARAGGGHGDERRAHRHPALAHGQRLRQRALRVARHVRGRGRADGGARRRPGRARSRISGPSAPSAARALRLAADAGAPRAGAAPALGARRARLCRLQRVLVDGGLSPGGAPRHYGSEVVGLFGVLGVLGALAAPLVGRVADCGGGRLVNVVGLPRCSSRSWFSACSAARWRASAPAWC